MLKAIELNKSKMRAELFNLSDIEAEAQEILAQAREQAQQVLAEAEKQCAALQEEARRQAFAQGFKEGKEQGVKAGHDEAFQKAQKEFAQTSGKTRETLEAVLSQFDRQKNELLWRAEQETVALAVAIAEKVTRQIGVLRPDTARETLKEALELVNRRSNVTIYVHSRDLEHLRQMTQNESVLAEFASIHFQADDAVEQGGCRVVTENGVVDAQLVTQIDRIGREMIQASDLHPRRRNDASLPAEALTPPQASVENSEEKTEN